MIGINITDMNPKSIAQTLKTTSGLPFEALLPIEMMEQALINEEIPSANTSAYSQARSRLPIRSFRNVVGASC